MNGVNKLKIDGNWIKSGTALVAPLFGVEDGRLTAMMIFVCDDAGDGNRMANSDEVS
jgi:hypothetical protein